MNYSTVRRATNTNVPENRPSARARTPKLAHTRSDGIIACAKGALTCSTRRILRTLGDEAPCLINIKEATIRRGGGEAQAAAGREPVCAHLLNEAGLRRGGGDTGERRRLRTLSGGGERGRGGCRECGNSCESSGRYYGHGRFDERGHRRRCYSWNFGRGESHFRRRLGHGHGGCCRVELGLGSDELAARGRHLRFVERLEPLREFIALAWYCLHAFTVCCCCCCCACARFRLGGGGIAVRGVLVNVVAVGNDNTCRRDYGRRQRL
ncbi:hypothetical protein C8R46DRAFT_116259 [Mycena filopes]|nr:hypothetical protein C8R46DRAFT_116259 [Mycena filopes]